MPLKILLSPDAYLDMSAAKVVHRCECRLQSLLPPYIVDAEETGVDLYSNCPSRDLVSLDAFDGGPLDDHLKEIQDGGSDAGSEPEPCRPVPPKKQKRKLALPPGCGEGWAKLQKVGADSSVATASASDPSILTGSLPPPSIKKAKGKGKRRGKHSSRPRGGQALKAAGGNAYASDTKRLQTKLISRGDIYGTDSYSLHRDGSRVSTGWQGRNPPPRSRSEIRRLYSARPKEMQEILETFFPVYADLSKPTFLIDADSRIIFFRTNAYSWMKEKAVPFHNAVKLLLDSTLSDKKEMRKNACGVRGAHFPCIIGHHRQYSKEPIMTRWHQDNMEKVEGFLATPVVQEYIKAASSVVSLIFPGIAHRFLKSVEWYEKEYNIKPLFGFFWNWCINGMFVGQKRIHCLPHADAKNIVGVCVLAIYELPGCHFNHNKRSWLVLWEAGVIIELPPWTMVAYPSALLFHFNIDITDFCFVTTEGKERPTPTNSQPISAGDDEGRGSLVFFNQASMYRLSELEGDTVAEAKKKGKSAVRDYGSDVQQAFESMTTYLPLR